MSFISTGLYCKSKSQVLLYCSWGRSDLLIVLGPFFGHLGETGCEPLSRISCSAHIPGDWVWQCVPVWFSLSPALQDMLGSLLHVVQSAIIVWGDSRLYWSCVCACMDRVLVQASSTGMHIAHIHVSLSCKLRHNWLPYTEHIRVEGFGQSFQYITVIIPNSDSTRICCYE